MTLREEIIIPNIFREWEFLVAAMSTRLGGGAASKFGMNLSYSVGDDQVQVARNREHFFGSLGIELRELAIPRQVHSATIHLATVPGEYPACDALISKASRVFLCVTVADCVPILLFDPHQLVVAVVHAGWRGTAEQIVAGVVRKMAKEFGTSPRTLRAFLGPCAGVCCYEVGREVAAEFDDRFVERRNSSLYVDLKGANSDQLLSLGVPSEQIEIDHSCTISESEVFHSYRRDGSGSGRMMAVLGMRGFPRSGS